MKKFNPNTLQLEVWQERPELISLELSKVQWKPSIHLLTRSYLHITGGDQDSTVAFVFHDIKKPFNEISRT